MKKTLAVVRYFSKNYTFNKRMFSSSHVFSQKSLPELTANRYPNLKRGAYSTLNANDLNYFKSVLGEDSAVLIEEEELHGYNADWLGIVRGQSKCVLKPKNTSQISDILKYCNEHNLAVCPQGGNTGLVGGSVPVFDEVVLSSQRMTNITSLDPIAGILTCQAGCVLEMLDNYVADHNLMMPIDLGAKGSCHIGGNVATNAGGIRLLRYGSLHGSVLGVEAVLASGEVIDCMSTLRKDNTGYDLKQLFIGSEGTLGFITAVSILCPQRPSSQTVALLACDSFDKVLQTLTLAKNSLGEILSAYEFLDNESMSVVCKNLKYTNPIGDCPFYVLVETSGSSSVHDEEKMSSFLASATEGGLVLDGTIASEPSKIKTIWQLRESVAEGLIHDGYCYKYDISLPLAQYYKLVEEMRVRLDGLAHRVCGYGHVGDGNLHFNVTSKEYSQPLRNKIEPFIYDYTSKYNGSISAEHGLGLLKAKYIYHSKAEPVVQIMQQMKQLFDPKGILNPYKTLPGKD